MLLDDLVTAIQTVQQRIREHGTSLSQNEYRTRLALIDPILNALGWDVSDPALVTPEYQAGNGRADYALLGSDGKPRAFIEAKRLNEPLESHQDQVFKYTWDQKLFYGGLTDGNRWILEDVTAAFSGRDGRLLDVTISKEAAHQCALKLLLLWHPTLAAGRPTKGSEPILGTHPEPGEHISMPRSLREQAETPFVYSDQPSHAEYSDGIASVLASVEPTDLMHANAGTNLIHHYIDPLQTQNREVRKAVKDHMESRGFKEFPILGEWGGVKSDDNRFCQVQLCDKKHAINRRFYGSAIKSLGTSST